MRHLGRIGTRSAATLAAAAAALGAGCASDREQAALEAYQQQQYRQAIDLAGPGARRSERAALIAGLAAQAAGDGARAGAWLAPLRDSPDPQIRGRALAGLGLVALDENRPGDAAESLRQAAATLDGPDAARALLLAGDACVDAGQDGQARSDYQIARIRAGGAQPITGELTARLGGAPAAPRRPGD